MRFRFAWFATFLIIAGCSGARTSLPPTAGPQLTDRHDLSVVSTGLRPYGRDLLVLKYDPSFNGFSFVAYSPYTLSGNKPDFDINTAESVVNGLSRDPTTNAFCFGGAQETIICDAPSPPGGEGVFIIPDGIFQVAVDHHGNHYGLFLPPIFHGTAILGWLKGNDGIDTGPDVGIRGPLTGIEGDSNIEFDERNELFVSGNGTLNGVTGTMSVDQRGDVATAVGLKIELFAAGAHGNAAPVKTLYGSHTGITGQFVAGVVYCDTDTLWVLVHPAAGQWQINLYAAGWNGDTQPTRVIHLPSIEPGGGYSNFTVY